MEFTHYLTLWSGSSVEPMERDSFCARGPASKVSRWTREQESLESYKTRESMEPPESTRSLRKLEEICTSKWQRKGEKD